MIKKLDHVSLMVHDMDQSIEFYSTYFGFKVRARGESATNEVCFLFLENQPGYEIELVRDHVPQTYTQNGIINHLAFTVENIEEAISYFRQKGITFHKDTPNIAPDGRKTIFFFGPNQELLQFVQPGVTIEE